MKKENLAIIEMLVCATLWSIAGIFIKLIPWNGFAVAGMRSLIAGATIAVYMLISRHRFVLSKKTFLAGVLSACVYTCFVCANKLTTAANAIVLQFTSPVFIVIFTALIYKTRIRKADAAVVTLTLLGIALFFFDQLQPGYILGNLVAIAAGMFMAGM
ncbi:MAG: DMT family transporter, partial [bacterium]|nr:DMT family transporter [bacterium]